MAYSNGRHKTGKQVSNEIEHELNALITFLRSREEEGNFIDCETVVKATVLVVSGHLAREALTRLCVPIGEHI